MRIGAVPVVLAATLLAAGCGVAGEDRAGEDGGAGNDTAELAARVQALEDERAIREVLVRYGETLDARDYAGYADLFAQDGVWTGGFGSATGPAEIEAMLRDNLGEAEPGFVNRDSFHQMTTMVVDVEGDEATARSRYMFYTADDNRPVPVLAGRYEDELVREDGAWKIARRTTHGVIPWRDGSAQAAQGD